MKQHDHPEPVHRPRRAVPPPTASTAATNPVARHALELQRTAGNAATTEVLGAGGPTDVRLQRHQLDPENADE